MKDAIDTLLTGKVTEKTITNVREMLQDAIRNDASPQDLLGPIRETLSYGSKFSPLYSNLMARKLVRECMCAGAFGFLAPDHAVAVVDNGSGGRIRTTGKSLYDYANPKDFLHECVDRVVDIVPYRIDPKDFTFLAFSNGRFVDRVEAPGLLARLRDAMPYPLTVYITYEDDPEDFRFSIKSVNPVLVDDQSHIRLGKDERTSMRQKDYRASPPSYEYFATASFVFDSWQEARSEGWGV